MGEREYTLIIIKPGAIKRGIAGEIISRFERAGITIEKMVLDSFSKNIIKELYKEHKEKDFYNELINTISEEKILVIVLSGAQGIIKKVRKMNGATNPLEATPGTIRGDYGSFMGPDNIVHASDSKEAVKREINIFFPET